MPPPRVHTSHSLPPPASHLSCPSVELVLHHCHPKNGGIAGFVKDDCGTLRETAPQRFLLYPGLRVTQRGRHGFGGQADWFFRPAGAKTSLCLHTIDMGVMNHILYLVRLPAREGSYSVVVAGPLTPPSRGRGDGPQSAEPVMAIRLTLPTKGNFALRGPRPGVLYVIAIVRGAQKRVMLF